MTAPSSDGRSALERDLGSVIYHQVLTAFLDLLPGQVAGLRDAAAAGDLAGAAYTAGQIMDAAPAFGAVRLAEATGVLCSRDGEPVDGARLVALVDEIDAAVRELLAVPRSHRRVLVADDNPVNQRVAAEMVENLGFTVDVVTDGAAAVRAALRTDYHAILMDWQMPELDGAAAATEIRRHQVGPGRVPIIAVSAAHVPDADRALAAAGMDDYLRKPFTQLALVAVLDRLVPGGAVPAEAADAVTADPTVAGAPAEVVTEVLDARIVDRLEHLSASSGEDLLGQLAGIFVAEATGRLEALHAGADDADSDAIKRSAHALRGASANLGATVLTDLCATLEHSCEAGDLLTVGSQLGAIEIEITRVTGALDAMTATSGRAAGP